jgi:hypothetical protein
MKNKIQTKTVVTTAPRTKTLDELKAEVDAKLELELQAAMTAYEQTRRHELGLAA